jgi:serine/threonine protein phosphatase PrpC
MSSVNDFPPGPSSGPRVCNSPPEPESSPKAPVHRLPNAMVGREFSAEIEPATLDPLSQLPPGLEIRETTLAGIPEISGEFEFILSSGITFALTINPDPRSLWKNFPSDESADFWKPDTAMATLDALFTIGASTRGRSHAHVGSFRDDDLAMATFPGPWHSLTVADGAGSAKFSRRGSQIACHEVTEHFARYFADPDNALTGLASEAPDSGPLRTELYNQFGGAAIAARKAIEEQAESSAATLRDFHTTLITTLLHPLPDGRWFVAAFSIGDGAAAIIGAPGDDPCLLTRPDGGEYAGQTVFLTMKEALAEADGIMARIRVAVVDDFHALILATDGITDPRFDSETAIADPQVWAELWQEIQTEIAPADSRKSAADALLAWMNFHSPGHHDDRTLVLAAPHFTPAQP